MLIEETGVADTTLPVDVFKAHLRMGSGFGTETLQDEVLVSFLRAAIAAVEARTGKALIRRKFSWSLSSWRDDLAQPFPIAPVHSVDSVTTISSDGAQTVVDAQMYWLDRDRQRPMLRTTSAALASIPRFGTVSITFEAGMGSDWSQVPADLQQAVFLLSAHYYEFRHETNLSDGCMPFGVSSLIERYRPMRLGMRIGG